MKKKEEMHHDISNLWNQVQQFSLSQNITKNELEAMMNVKIDDIKRHMEILYYGLKSNMEAMMNVKIEGLKEGLAKLLEERHPSGDREIHENHDGDKRSINYDFRDSSVGFKNHHNSKIDMRNFDGKDLIT